VHTIAQLSEKVRVEEASPASGISSKNSDKKRQITVAGLTALFYLALQIYLLK